MQPLEAKWIFFGRMMINHRTGINKEQINQERIMKKIRAVVVGYGNIGHYAVQALETAPDFEIAGIVRRNGAENKPAELAGYEVVKDITELKDVDVAILATRASLTIVLH